MHLCTQLLLLLLFLKPLVIYNVREVLNTFSNHSQEVKSVIRTPDYLTLVRTLQHMGLHDSLNYRLN